MAHNIKKLLIDEIAEFRTKHEMHITTFGKLVMKDPSFVSRLEATSSVSSETIDKCRDFMDNYKHQT